MRPRQITRLLCALFVGIVAISGNGRADEKTSNLYSSIATGPYDNRTVNATAALIDGEDTNGRLAGLVTVKDASAALRRLREKKVDVAIVPSDVAWAAYKSYKPFIGQPEFNDLRVLGSIDEDNLVLITRQLRGARRIKQMQQYRVGLVGPVYDIFDYILEANDMSVNDLAYARPLTRRQSFEALCGGEADLIVMFAGNNDPTIQALYNQCPVMILPLEQATIAALTDRFTFLGRSGFQTRWYVPTAYVIDTISRSLLLVAQKDLSPEKVDFWSNKLEEKSDIGGESPWLLAPVSGRGREKMAGLPVHEKLAPKGVTTAPQKNSE